MEGKPVSASELHLERLQKYKVTLMPNGEVSGKKALVHFDEDVFLDYRDEGPDAWANSMFFSGPAWLWTASDGWEYFKNGVKLTGNYGLNNATIVNVEKDGLHVRKCNSSEY